MRIKTINIYSYQLVFVLLFAIFSSTSFSQMPSRPDDYERINTDLYVNPDKMYKPKVKITKHQGVVLIPKKDYGKSGWLEMGLELLNSLGDDWYIFSSQDLPASMRFKYMISFDININKKDYSQQILDAGIPKIEGDSHLFRILTIDKAKTLFIYGINDRAKILGGFYIAQLVRQDSDKIWILDRTVRKPAYPLRLISSKSPDFGLTHGFNVIVPENYDPAKMVFYKSFSPSIFSNKDKETYNRTINNRKYFVDILTDTKKSKLDFALQCREFIFPKEILNSIYKEQVVSDIFKPNYLSKGNFTGEIFSFSKPILWNFLKVKYKEILSDFYDIDFVIIQPGINIVNTEKSDYIGNKIFLNPASEKYGVSDNLSFEDKISKLVNETHKTIVSESKKYLIFQLYDEDQSSLHSKPDIYQKVVSKIEDKTKLIFSVKYSAGLNTPYFDFNPIISTDDNMDKIVEFNCSRENEGNGAFPDFLGEEYYNAFQKFSSSPVIGVWVSGADDTTSPASVLNLWKEANLYAVSRLMWDPKTLPTSLAGDFASMTFGIDSAANISQILLKSPVAVKKAFYFEKYSGKNKNANVGWIEKNLIKGGESLEKIYNEYKNNIGELLNEKKESIYIVDEMQNLLEKEKKKITKQEKIYLSSVYSQIVKDRFTSGEDLYNAVSTSLKYEKALFQVFYDYCDVYFSGMNWKNEKKNSDRIQAEKAIERWEQSWKYYNEEIAKLPYAPSLFRDGGMVNTVSQIKSFVSGN